MTTHRDYVQTEMDKYFYSVSDKDVLEIGPGAKPFDTYFEELGYKWYGVDKTGKYAIASMENLEDFGCDIYDLVFSCHSFEHCERPIDALKEFYRVLKKGGKIFIATPYHCEHQVLRGDADHIFVLTDMQMERLLRYTGFKVEKVFISKEAGKEQDWNLITIGVKDEN